MSTSHFNQTTEASTTNGIELAHRSNAGIDVTLVWLQGERVDRVLVRVCDQLEGAYFEIATEPYRALDAYYHPFAYRNSSSDDDEDSRLAA